MVNNHSLRIVAPDACSIVPTMDKQGQLRDKIANGPVYNLSVAQSELKARKLFFVTETAAENQYDIIGGSDLRMFIAALKHPRHYVGWNDARHLKG